MTKVWVTSFSVLSSVPFTLYCMLEFSLWFALKTGRLKAKQLKKTVFWRNIVVYSYPRHYPDNNYPIIYEFRAHFWLVSTASYLNWILILMRTSTLSEINWIWPKKWASRVMSKLVTRPARRAEPLYIQRYRIKHSTHASGITVQILEISHFYLPPGFFQSKLQNPSLLV